MKISELPILVKIIIWVVISVVIMFIVVVIGSLIKNASSESVDKGNLQNIVQAEFEKAYANQIEQILEDSLFQTTILANDTSPVPIKYTFSGNFDSISDLDAFKTDIINNIASGLSIDISNVKILNIYKGSVVISFIINRSFTNEMLKKLNSPTTILQNLITKYNLGNVSNVTFALPKNLLISGTTLSEIPIIQTQSPTGPTQSTQSPTGPTIDYNPPVTIKPITDKTPPPPPNLVIDGATLVGGAIIGFVTNPIQLGAAVTQMALEELIKKLVTSTGRKAIAAVVSKAAYKASSFGLRATSKAFAKLGIKGASHLAALGAKAGAKAAKIAAQQLSKKVAVTVAQKLAVKAAASAVSKFLGPVSIALDIFSFASMGLDIADVSGYGKMGTKKMYYQMKKDTDKTLKDLYDELGVIEPIIKGPDIDFTDVSKILEARMKDENDPIMKPMIQQMTDAIRADITSGAMKAEDVNDPIKMEKYAYIIDGMKIQADIIQKKCLDGKGKIVPIIDPMSKYTLKENNIDLNKNISSYNNMSLGFCEKNCSNNKNCKAFGYRNRKMLDDGVTMDDDDINANCWLYDGTYTPKEMTGHNMYIKTKDVPDNIDMCSYTADSCVKSYSWPLKDGEEYVEYKKTNIDRNVNGVIKNINEDLCVSSNSIMKTICDSNNMKYGSDSGICQIDKVYCQTKGAEWVMDNDLKEYDCQISSDQEFAEAILGTTIYRGAKQFFDLSQYEKCTAGEDDKGRYCQINCDKKYPGQKGFYDITKIGCVKCPNKYVRTLASVNNSDACKAGSILGDCSVVYGDKSFQHLLTGDCYKCPDKHVRTLTSIDAPDACKAGGILGDCGVVYGDKSFQHLVSGDCYTCPDNYSRTLTSIDAPDACKAGGILGDCPATYPGTFQHMLSGDCYKCPDNYSRTLSSIDAPDACKGGGILSDCPATYPGTFQHMLTGDCYKCPDKYSRTLAPIDAPDACKAGGILGDCPATYPGTFQHMSSGDCYKCPDKYVRTLASIDAPDACKAGSITGNCNVVYGDKSFQHWTSGDCYSCPDKYVRTLAPIDASDACKAGSITGDCGVVYGNRSFQHWTTGDCYTCPANYVRTLASIDAPDACKAGSIGGDCTVAFGNDSFQHWTSGDCYSCNGGSRNGELAGSGRECSMECANGFGKDLAAGLCYKCPAGFNRNLRPVTASDSCTEGWKVWSTAKAETYPFVKPWTYKGNINSKATKVGSINAPVKKLGSINSKVNKVGSIHAPAEKKGSINSKVTKVGSINAPAKKVGSINAKATKVGSINAHITVMDLSLPIRIKERIVPYSSKENFLKYPQYSGVF